MYLESSSLYDAPLVKSTGASSTQLNVLAFKGLVSI